MEILRLSKNVLIGRVGLPFQGERRGCEHMMRRWKDWKLGYDAKREVVGWGNGITATIDMNALVGPILREQRQQTNAKD